MSYDEAAQVQREVISALFGRLPVGQTAHSILDVGCGTGQALDALRQQHPDAQLLALDFSSEMLAQTGRRPAAATIHRLCADAEAVPLASGCIDLYWSSLTLQWCHLPAALAEAGRLLQPNGVLAFATLSEDTFHELRTAFAGLDTHPHTHRFLSPDAITAATVDAGFRDITLTRESRVAWYPDLRTLLRAVKAVGANEVGNRRRGMLGRHAWEALERRYEEFSRSGLLPATYDVIYVTARRP